MKEAAARLYALLLNTQAELQVKGDEDAEEKLCEFMDLLWKEHGPFPDSSQGGFVRLGAEDRMQAVWEALQEREPILKEWSDYDGFLSDRRGRSEYQAIIALDRMAAEIKRLREDTMTKATIKATKPPAKEDPK